MGLRNCTGRHPVSCERAASIKAGSIARRRGDGAWGAEGNFGTSPRSHGHDCNNAFCSSVVAETVQTLLLSPNYLPLISVLIKNNALGLHGASAGGSGDRGMDPGPMRSLRLCKDSGLAARKLGAGPG
eukprot:763340-Hanusia_phi.AAC.1